MSTISARVPTRLDLSGGTLDVWPVHLALPEPGVTVNVALDVPAEAIVSSRPDDAIVLRSEDRDEVAHFADRGALEAALRARTAPLALVGRCVTLATERGGLEVTTRAHSPLGAGLGGSSALAVAVLGAVAAWAGTPLGDCALHERAQAAETMLLRRLTGYQDHVPPIHGGLLAIEGRPEGKHIETLEAVPLEALAARLRLVYTGEPHDSAETNWQVLRGFLEGESHARTSLERIAEISRAQRAAFRAGDLGTALAATVEDGRVRRTMAPDVTTARIEALDAAVRGAGALGTKICGAGGGGCVMVVVDDPAADEAVDACLARIAGEQGMQILPMGLPREGLVIQRA